MGVYLIFFGQRSFGGLNMRKERKRGKKNSKIKAGNRTHDQDGHVALNFQLSYMIYMSNIAHDIYIILYFENFERAMTLPCLNVAPTLSGNKNFPVGFSNL